MQKLKIIDVVGVGAIVEKEEEIIKINEIIDWINEHDKDKKKYKGMIDKIMEMREKEHKMAMEITELSKKMFEKIEKE